MKRTKVKEKNTFLICGLGKDPWSVIVSHLRVRETQALTCVCRTLSRWSTQDMWVRRRRAAYLKQLYPMDPKKAIREFC